MRLTGTTAIITGARSGIGVATARLFAAEGASVVIVDRVSPSDIAADDTTESPEEGES